MATHCKKIWTLQKKPNVSQPQFSKAWGKQFCGLWKKKHQVVIKKQIQIIFRYVCFGVSDFDKNFLVKKCVSVKYLCKWSISQGPSSFLWPSAALLRKLNSEDVQIKCSSQSLTKRENIISWVTKAMRYLFS